jgi:hypothetical protein
MTGTEIEITADLVRDLLREQHPDLAGLAIREVAGGWGNQMWCLGDELAVRMQRMDRTPELQLKERRRRRRRLGEHGAPCRGHRLRRHRLDRVRLPR